MRSWVQWPGTKRPAVLATVQHDRVLTDFCVVCVFSQVDCVQSESTLQRWLYLVCNPCCCPSGQPASRLACAPECSVVHSTFSFSLWLPFCLYHCYNSIVCKHCVFPTGAGAPVRHPHWGEINMPRMGRHGGGGAPALHTLTGCWRDGSCWWMCVS